MNYEKNDVNLNCGDESQERDIFYSKSDFDYEKYEEECKKIIEKNNKLITIFEEEIKEKLSPRAVKKHVFNVGLYINVFLLRVGPLPMEKGTELLDWFSSNFFIRKCMWSAPATIKSTAASLKKFYQCMLKHNKITKEAFDDLCYYIKEYKESWIELCEEYDSGGWGNPFM